MSLARGTNRDVVADDDRQEAVEMMDMSVVSRKLENETKSSIRGTVNGRIPRMLLIQVSGRGGTSSMTSGDLKVLPGGFSTHQGGFFRHPSFANCVTGRERIVQNWLASLSFPISLLRCSRFTCLCLHAA